MDGFKKLIIYKDIMNSTYAHVKSHASGHPYSISVFKSDVFWTDWATNSIFMMEKSYTFLGNKIRTFRTNITNIMDIKLFSELSESGNLSCDCQYLCVRVPKRLKVKKFTFTAFATSQPKCLCPDSFPHVVRGFQ